MTPASATPSLIQQAMEMVRAGYGWEDLAVRLDIPKYAARYFVLGPPKKPEAK